MTEFYKALQHRKETTGKPYVIADLGSNWIHENELMNAPALAKSCGADAIKYQWFSEMDMYGTGSDVAQFEPDMLRKLSEKCNATGIDFLCTAFAPDRLRMVNEYVKAHKIASCEMMHLRLLQAVKDTGKPIILSTGGHSLADIQKAVTHVQSDELVVMHCNLKYPAEYVNLIKWAAISESLEREKPFLLGFSDHTKIIDIVPIVMKNYGSTVYEKHFNPFDYENTPDAGHSLNVYQFRAMVQSMNGMRIDYNDENDARTKHHRRVIATRDIERGEPLIEGRNMGIFRSRKFDAKGMHPFSIDSLEGRATVNAIKCGEGIGPFDVA